MLVQASWWEGLCLLAGGWSWVLALWWAGLCLGACLEEAVGSGSLHAAYLLMGGAVFPPS